MQSQNAGLKLGSPPVRGQFFQQMKLNLRGSGRVSLETLTAIRIQRLRAGLLGFYKRVTTHGDHRIWQDVYRGITADGIEVYLKLTVIDDLLIVSFKEL